MKRIKNKQVIFHISFSRNQTTFYLNFEQGYIYVRSSCAATSYFAFRVATLKYILLFKTIIVIRFRIMLALLDKLKN